MKSGVMAGHTEKEGEQVKVRERPCASRLVDGALGGFLDDASHGVHLVRLVSSTYREGSRVSQGISSRAELDMNNGAVRRRC